MEIRKQAYLAVVVPTGYGIGLCVENEAGYHPQPSRGVFSTWDEAHAHATGLNASELGLDMRDAYIVVSSSLRPMVRRAF